MSAQASAVEETEDSSTESEEPVYGTTVDMKAYGVLQSLPVAAIYDSEDDSDGAEAYLLQVRWAGAHRRCLIVALSFCLR